MREKYKMYKELSKQLNVDQKNAVNKFWSGCKDNKIFGFAIFMVLLPLLIFYGGLAIWYWWQMRQTTKRLNEEIKRVNDDMKSINSIFGNSQDLEAEDDELEFDVRR